MEFFENRSDVVVFWGFSNSTGERWMMVRIEAANETQGEEEEPERFKISFFAYIFANFS